MKKISIISPVFKNTQKLEDNLKELDELFKDKYEYEVLYYHSEVLPKNLQSDSRFKFVQLEKKMSFDDCVTDGFEKANGNCIIVADLNDVNYKDYITKLIVAWENNAQVVLIKHKRRRPSIFQKLGSFFAEFGRKISNGLLSIVGLGKDFGAMRNFQLFNENVVSVIKEFPKKNYYLRNFDCWVDYRVTVLYTDNKIKVKNHRKSVNANFYYFISSLALFLGLLFTEIFVSGSIDVANRSMFVLIGVALMVVFVSFSLYHLYKWFIFLKTRLTSKTNYSKI